MANYCMDDYISAGFNKFFNTDALSSFSFLKQSCLKTHPVVVKKIFICFRRVTLLASSKENIYRDC